MAFRRGREAIQQAATRVGFGKFVPDIHWEAGEVKFIQFLQPIEEVVTVLMHPFCYVGERDDGSKIVGQFISRRDPQLDGADGYDPLIDRFGLSPTNRSIALAVELEPDNPTKPKKFTLARRQFETKDGTTKDVPAIGLIVQSPFTFYNQLDSVADVTPIQDVVLRVKRTGKTTDTQYAILPVGEALPLEEDDEVKAFQEEFDFDAYLDDLADEDRVHRLIDPLPSDWVVNKFAKKGKKDSSESGTSSRRTRNAPAEDEPAEAEPEAEEPSAPPVTRTRRFSQLRDDIAASKK